MKFIIFTLLLLCIHQVCSKSDSNVVNTLKNLKLILHHMKDFTKNLQFLKRYLTVIHKKQANTRASTTKNHEISTSSSTVTEMTPQEADIDSTNMDVEPKVAMKSRPKPNYSSVIKTVHVVKFKKMNLKERCEKNAYCNNYVNPNLKKLKYKGQEGFKNYMKVEGEIIKSCGNKHYIFGTGKKQGFPDIWAICCKYSFVPAVIRTRDDLKCINSLFKNVYSKVTSKNQEEFLMSGYDFMLDGNFYVCEENRTVPESLWAPKQPDNISGMDTCLMLRLSVNDTMIGYDDKNCAISGHVLCQAEVKN